MSVIENLEKMLAAGQDGATLRFGLGQAYLSQSKYEEAIFHLQSAIEFDHDYSAAWKLLGKARVGSGNITEAKIAYESGIAAAEKKGDIQAAKEMRVFLKRLLT